MNIKLSEIFKSIQGEGLLQGVPSVLVRMVGCNLHCWWCDTKSSFANNEGFNISIDELLERLSTYECRNIVITGGEPLLNDHISEIVNVLKREKYHVTIETNATIIREVDCDLVSLSPKLSHSVPYNLKDDPAIQHYNCTRLNIEAIQYYIRNTHYQLKFVVRDRKEDIDEVKGILQQIGDYNPFHVLLMPLASSRAELFQVQKNLVKLCVQNGLRYANRLQLQIWDTDAEE